MKPLPTIIAGILVAMLASVTLAGVLPWTNATQEVQEQARIVAAQSEFQKLVSATPTKSIRATVFFNTPMSLEDVRNALFPTPLVLKGFRHETTSSGGGYTLHEDETLDEAIEAYRRDHLLFLDRRIEMQERMLTASLHQEQTEEELAFKAALQAILRKSQQARVDLQKHGLPIVGLELEGRAIDFDTFQQQHTFVRVIELIHPGRPQPSILPQE